MIEEMRESLCGYTEDHTGSPNGIICVDYKGSRVLLDRDDNTIGSPCPNCEWEKHLEYCHGIGCGQSDWPGFVISEKRRVLVRVMLNYQSKKHVGIAPDYDTYHEYAQSMKDKIRVD